MSDNDKNNEDKLASLVRLFPSVSKELIEQVLVQTQGNKVKAMSLLMKYRHAPEQALNTPVAPPPGLKSSVQQEVFSQMRSYMNASQEHLYSMSEEEMMELLNSEPEPKT